MSHPHRSQCNSIMGNRRDLRTGAFIGAIHRYFVGRAIMKPPKPLKIIADGVGMISLFIGLGCRFTGQFPVGIVFFDGLNRVSIL